MAATSVHAQQPIERSSRTLWSKAGSRGTLMASAMHGPEYWLNRAREARAQARDMITPEARREMLLIAAGYQRLAEHAERTAGRKSPQSQGK